MLYTFHSTQLVPHLPALPGLHIGECADPALMAALGETTPDETTRRFAEGHRAYVALLGGVPAAFGWVATRQARIGELDHTFTLPEGHRYLWNFRTRPAYRGRGIYPRLLHHILLAQQTEATHQWIMHAPENDSSERGIQKAGFRLVGKVSVLHGYEVIFTPQHGVVRLEEVLQTFGFSRSDETPASCWNCSSPYLKNRQPECCCTKKNKECTRNLFAMQTESDILVP